MKNEIDIVLSPAEAANDEAILKCIKGVLGIKISEAIFYKIIRKSIDARGRNLKINARIQVSDSELEIEQSEFAPAYQNVSQAIPVIIVGAGPAGLFAALRLLEMGLKPIIIERGKNVRDRRRDLAAISKLHQVNPNSNYCFGEGGAGTYSDGKLYTRSTKRGDVTNILNTLVFHGADPIILVDAHPHIGTNKLPDIIVNIRETILKFGGEIHFNTQVTNFIQKENSIQGVVCTETIEPFTQKEFIASSVILATGHSANDVYNLLHTQHILLEEKPFAIGVRVEHPQSLIDSIQYHCRTEEQLLEAREFLPAASYSLVKQIKGRGVYSFCMCPGGIIAPCATQNSEVVTNGWSPSKRNNPYANSGIVTTIEAADYAHLKDYGVLAGLAYRSELEKAACIAAGGTQAAPAQRLVDFLNNNVSPTLPDCSYQPGIKSVSMKDVLTYPIWSRLQIAFKEFGKKMHGYVTNEAVLIGIESRTSSPLRIPRDKETMEHPQVMGLYPCGEGAGYAGGIVSAAIDGQLCAEKIAAAKS